MDKTINDILDEKRMWIDETAELRKRLDTAYRKQYKLYDLLEQGNDDVMPLIKENEVTIAQIEAMIEEYETEIRKHRDKLLIYIKELIKPKGIKYAKPRIKKRYKGHPLEAIAKEIDEMIENRRVPGRNNKRKGRVKYVKINKVQD